MQGRSSSIGLLLRANVCGVLFLIPAAAWATNAGSADKLLREAADLEQKGDWRGAGEIYWRILAQDKQASAELRQKYLICLRHVRLTDRHNDPVYRKRVQDLPLSKSLTAYFETLGKLQSNYVDKDKIELTALFRHGLAELGFALGDSTFRQTYLGEADAEAIASFTARINEQWTKELLRQPADARKAVKEIALLAQQNLNLKPSIVVMEFVCGACNALDERTGFLPPGEEYTTHVSQLNALGVLLASNTDNILFVDRVTAGSWAAQMGFKAGDRIVRMSRKDNKDEVGPLTELDLMTRGETAARTIKLPETVPSVTDWDILPDGVGYLRLSSFSKSTLTEIDETLTMMRGMGMGLKALVLDLRGNPGGSFNVSVQVAERFLPDGIIVSTQGQTSRTFESHSGMAALDMPLVVLVDGETASAAEVLAGALKENRRAKLVGMPTYGKGTIQTVLQLTDAGGVRITLARFFTPTGQPYNGVGVAPDILESMRIREVGVQHAREMLSMRQ